MELTLTDLANIAQVIGALAVVISLVYLAIQVRRGATADRSNAGNAANLALQGWYQEVGTNAQSSGLFIRALTSQESLPRDEEYQFLLMMHALLLAFQNSYFLAKEGALDSELREAMTVAIRAAKDLPGMSRYWRQRRNYFLSGFAEYVDKILAAPTINAMDIYRAPDAPLSG